MEKNLTMLTDFYEFTMLRNLLDAANLAPVGRKKYDEVHLTVVQNRQFFDDLTDRFRAETGNPGASPLYSAPTLIVVSVKAPDGEPSLVAMGKVIGRQGRIAKELRAILKALGQREEMRVTIDILD